MALSNDVVAQKISAFLTKYFEYDVRTETLTFNLADFNNNIQSYLAALRTDFMLAVSGESDAVYGLYEAGVIQPLIDRR